MKNFTTPVILTILYFFSGCNDSVVNNKRIEESNHTVVNKQSIVEQEIKQVVLPIKEKIAVKKKSVKPKKNKNTAKSNIEENSVLAEKGQNRRVLDLTLPDGIKKQIASNTKGYQKRAYLPDLFPRKKKKKYPLQVDGKIFDRVEKEADKVSSLDGVGIDVRLYP